MAALATLEDVEARLGRELTAAEQARVEALLADASAMVRSYTKQDFEQAETTEVLPVIADRAVLPQRPVTAVSSVKLLWAQGNGTNTRIPVPYAWDELDQVTWDLATIINTPEIDEPTSTVEVTYTHGYAEVPADVVAVVAGMAMRVLAVPEGLRSVTVGGYSEVYAVPATGVPYGAALTPVERATLNRYRRTATTVGLLR